MNKKSLTNSESNSWFPHIACGLPKVANNVVEDDKGQPGGIVICDEAVLG